MPPRVSAVKYLNTLPLVWGMMKGPEAGRFELDFTTPANCAGALRQRNADLGIIPSIEYQRIQNLQILPGLSIASKQTVKSVLLFSTKPIGEIRTVAADTSSRTSVALTTVILRKFYNLEFQMEPAEPDLQQMLHRADAALVIGDPALIYDQKRTTPHVYDLAAEWRAYTGLSFVFAVWAGPKASQIGRYRADFEASRDFGLEHVDEIAREMANKLPLDPEAIKVYLTENIDYSLDEENCEGLRLFYGLAEELKLIPAVRELDFA